MEQDSEIIVLQEPHYDPLNLLPIDRRLRVLGIYALLLGDGRRLMDVNAAISAFCERLVEAGLPLDRHMSVSRLLHSTQIANVKMWERDIGVVDVAIPYKSELDHAYSSSPLALAHRLNSWIAFNPQAIENERFGIVAELKKARFHDYVCAPLRFANQMENGFSFATKSPSGFGYDDHMLLRAVLPALSTFHEVIALERMLNEVTRIYVGDEPQQRILMGDVHRGEVTEIKAAILFSDARGFTQTTRELHPVRVTAMLNNYFDCIVPAVEAFGGEVLKFIGDGVLAIFRNGAGAGDACQRALSAARQGLRTLKEWRTRGEDNFEAGVALHYGNVAYGNIGSGTRLDYTVIGSDVNLASRLSGLCGELRRDILASEEFCRLLPAARYEPAGTYNLKGFEGEISVLELDLGEEP